MDGIIKTFLHENEAALTKITDFMLEYNTHTNLTRIVEPDEIIEKHYIDSILPLILYSGEGNPAKPAKPSVTVPRGTSCLDVGSGAGFPGIPMKLFRPDLDVTLLDSAKKRTDYLSALLRHIEVECRVVTARSEMLSHEPSYREKYELVTARAVANLASLCEYCLPFVKVGGVFLAMKGQGAPAGELADSKKACKTLGGELSDVIEYELPSGDKRNLIVIKKIKQTPTEYPRKRINITKHPIA